MSGKISGRTLVLLVLVALVFIGGGVALRNGFEQTRLKRLDAEVERLLAAIAADGYPVTTDELDAWLALPEGVENAAEIYAKAFAAYVEDEQLEQQLPMWGDVEEPELGQPYPQEMIEAAKEYVEKNTEALRLLHAAGRMKHCRFPVDIDGGYSSTLPHLRGLRQGAKLLSLEAMLHVESGRYDDAMESIVLMFSLGSSLERDHFMISSLVRISCMVLANASIEGAVNQSRLTGEQLSSFSDAFKTISSRDIFKTILLGEMHAANLAFKSHDYQMLVDNDFFESVKEAKKASRSGELAEEHIEFLEKIHLMLKAADLPVVERDKKIKVIMESLTYLTPFYHMTGDILLSLSSSAGVHVKFAAMVRSTIAGLAVERYRIKYGKLPESLDVLVPEYLDAVPVDPFDGQAIRYLKTEPGFVTYSIGEDMKDNQGMPRPGETVYSWNEYDYPFRVIR